MSNPVPEHIWRRIEEQWIAAALTFRIAGWVIMTAGFVSVADLVVNDLRDPTWVRHVVIPLWLIGLFATACAIVMRRCAMRRARKLMIEYHGVDPDDTLGA